MKVLFVGDIHNHTYILDDIMNLDNKCNFNKIILFGDYIDDWNTDNHDSLRTLERVFNMKDMQPNKYILLIGNHELSYLGYPCSGHKIDLEELVTLKLRENYGLLNLFTEIQLGNRNYICSHAGFSKPFIDEVLEDDWRESMLKIYGSSLKPMTMCSRKRGGLDPYSSPLWTDRKEHMEFLNFNIVHNDTRYQIIGHSPVKSVANYNTGNADYYFIDTHSTYMDGSEYGDKSYLTWNEDKFEIINGKGEIING